MELSSKSSGSGGLESIQAANMFDISQLPESFQKFLKTNDIDPAIYTVSDLPRYVRWNTQIEQDKRPSLEDLQRQLGTERVWNVAGRPGFFGFIGAKNRLVDTEAYKQAAIFGIDLSSAVAVEALEIQCDDHVLDTCCAPGAKLCMIANLLGDKGTGTVTGVDLAAHRLATCRSMLKRYSAGGRARLFEADGTKFAVPPPSRLGQHILDMNQPPGKKQKMQPVKPFWAPKLLRSDPQTSQRLYDKVLVDAECTHDGSISHILKYEKWGWDAFEKNFMDPKRLDTICELQRNLMKQGWTMLKENGVMVYSTCSLTIQQNEANVVWFLEHHPDAKIENIPNIDNLDIHFASIKTVNTSSTIQKLIDDHCIRFDPLVSRTSGFFVARFKKIAN